MIRKKSESNDIVIDLTGPDGNAYALMAHVTQLARKLGIAPDPIITEMTSGDYENLVNVFDKHFGKFVILER